LKKFRIVELEEVERRDRALRPDQDRCAALFGLAADSEITLRLAPFLVGPVARLLGLALA
jgi:hypothetical protein